MATDLSQAPSLAQGGSFPSIDGDRLFLAGLAGPQKTPARSMRWADVQNVRMRYMLDRLALVRFARLVGLVGLVKLVGLVSVCRAGLEVSRCIRRYHWRGVIRIKSIPRLRPESWNVLYPLVLLRIVLKIGYPRPLLSYWQWNVTVIYRFEIIFILTLSYAFFK